MRRYTDGDLLKGGDARDNVARRAHTRREGTREALREGFAGLDDRRRRMMGQILRAVRDRAEASADQLPDTAGRLVSRGGRR